MTFDIGILVEGKGRGEMVELAKEFEPAKG